MTGFILGIAVALTLLIAVLLYRVCVGPTAIDRIVAVNAIGTKTTVLLVLIGLIFNHVGMFVDFALAYGLLNFMGSLAVARYFQKSEQRAERESKAAENEAAKKADNMKPMGGAA